MSEAGKILENFGDEDIIDKLMALEATFGEAHAYSFIEDRYLALIAQSPALMAQEMEAIDAKLAEAGDFEDPEMGNAFGDVE